MEMIFTLGVVIGGGISSSEWRGLHFLFEGGIENRGR